MRAIQRVFSLPWRRSRLRDVLAADGIPAILVNLRFGRYGHRMSIASGGFPVKFENAIFSEWFLFEGSPWKRWAFFIIWRLKLYDKTGS